MGKFIIPNAQKFYNQVEEIMQEGLKEIEAKQKEAEMKGDVNREIAYGYSRVGFVDAIMRVKTLIIKEEAFVSEEGK